MLGESVSVAGLVIGVGSLVLAGVAMWLAWMVNRRGEQLNAQFIQSLQKIDDQVESIKGEMNERIGTAWNKYVIGGLSEIQPSPEIVELAYRVRQIETSALVQASQTSPEFPNAIRGVVDDLIQKVDKIERSKNRVIEYLLLREAAEMVAKAKTLPPELHDMLRQEYRDRKLFLLGDSPIGDIPEVMVSPEELLGQGLR